MRINDECVRDILFAIEEVTTFEQPFFSKGYQRRCPSLKKYDEDTFLYHLRYIEMKNLIFMPDKKREGAFDLTPDGHDFLKSIRENMD